MLPQAGGVELIFLAAVALIVVGPKDLPVLLRKLGQFTAKMRGLAAEFRSSFDEMARQSELDDLRKEVDALRQGQLTSGVTQAQTEVESHFRDIGDHLNGGAAERAAQEAAYHQPWMSDPSSAPSVRLDGDETVLLPFDEPPAEPKPRRKRAPAATAAPAPSEAAAEPKPRRKRAPKAPAASETAP